MTTKRLETLLYFLSLFISGLFVFGYILDKFFSPSWLTDLVYFSNEQNFIIIFVCFIILCNLPNLVGIIRGIVRDKISEQTIMELVPTIKEKLRGDKNLIKELIDEYNNKNQESKIKPSDINK